MVDLSSDDLWVIATCAVCAVACALPGVFLMLSRASLLGDAIAHSVLPGIAVAFIISGTRNPIVMLGGALVAGLLTALCASAINRSTVIKPDSSLGIVFTSFFSIGVVLITIVARQIDLDPGCVLYGLAEFIPFDTMRIGLYEIPRSFVWLSAMALINLGLLTLFWKELSLATFDPGLAKALGFRPEILHYGLLVCVTATIVASFEAVGSILVVAMLVVPAATASLMSSSLAVIVILAGSLAALSAVLGYLGALTLNTSVAGMMATTGGALFVMAVVLSPTQGIVVRYAIAKRIRYRIVRDDILGMLFRWHEVVRDREAHPLTVHDVRYAIQGDIFTPLALWSLRRSKDIMYAPDGTLRLTQRGIIEARALVRSHRLWEAYLAKHLGLPLDHLHAPSERTEHFIGRALAEEIAQDLATQQDPHGKSIP